MCINCESKKVEKVFIIKDRGSGSVFDMTQIEISLCKNCIKKLKIREEWFEEQPVWDGEYNEYVFESKIVEVLNKIPNNLLIKDFA